MLPVPVLVFYIMLSYIPQVHHHGDLGALALHRLPSRRRLHRLQGYFALGQGRLYDDPAAAHEAAAVKVERSGAARRPQPLLVY